MEKDAITQKQISDKILSATITHVVHAEGIFKLYSYRCIGHEDFVAQIAHSVKQMQDDIKKAEKLNLKIAQNAE